MATIVKRAEAVWKGSGKDGQGTLTTESGALSGANYSFKKRFGEEKGTNPEELIGAAHAGCFSMALAFQLGGAGYEPEELHTKAVVKMEQEGAGWKIAAVELTLQARIPGISEDEFHKLADAAKANCPVSKVLNANITLKTELAS
ncbi:osmotically inducible protein OsmC [Faunimonas pinastri]|uniref:Osmotically inducible protein OsmC n=1 Tax=Faunimonas pinastri TaxID=1855383 RepID=A0A1H9N7T8_9HYPH|nr:osmotically inducible protein OsmC [Faunimonas pinastri]